jgi:hypothetical protein
VRRLSMRGGGEGGRSADVCLFKEEQKRGDSWPLFRQPAPSRHPILVADHIHTPPVFNRPFGEEAVQNCNKYRPFEFDNSFGGGKRNASELLVQTTKALLQKSCIECNWNKSVELQFANFVCVPNCRWCDSIRLDGGGEDIRLEQLQSLFIDRRKQN